eukprot:m.182745 g.182745  ORF g.182745 m.182745 type:complete len:346 (-) comp17463_c1_seq6:1194-2231(-)
MQHPRSVVSVVVVVGEVGPCNDSRRDHADGRVRHRAALHSEELVVAQLLQGRAQILGTDGRVRRLAHVSEERVQRSVLDALLGQILADGPREVQDLVPRSHALAGRDEVQVDEACARVGRCLADGGLHQVNSLDDVLAGHGRGEAHLGVGLGQTHKRLQLAGRGRDRLAVVAQLAHVNIRLHQLSRRILAQLRRHVLARIGDVLGQRLARHDVLLLGRPLGILVVQRHHVASEAAVLGAVWRVENEVDEVETREQCRRQLDVLHNRQVGVPARLVRVGGGKDRCPRVQRRNDAGLGNRHRLLLHDLVQDGAGAVGHLVKLVDAHDAAVSEDHGACLETPLARLCV